MKIQINLELIPAPPENGTSSSLCEGCFFQWVEVGKQTAGRKR